MCKFSNFVVTYSSTGNDTVSFTLNASVTTPYPATFSLGYSVTAIPTYYDVNNNVITWPANVTVATGGATVTMSSPYNNSLTLYVNPRATIQSNAPYGTVSYKYTYQIKAPLTDSSNTVVASDTQTYAYYSGFFYL
jgi:hypothetical protein